MKSLFEIDSKFEKVTIEYIKEHHIFEALGFTSPEYITDEKTQKKGVDVYAMRNGKKYAIDIKSIASDLPTFSQEVINTSSEKIGWMFNNELETDYYVYAYFFVKGAKNYGEGKELAVDNPSKITGIRFILVSKKTLQKDIEENLKIKCNEENAFKLYDKIQANLDKKQQIATKGRYRYKTVEINGKIELRELNGNGATKNLVMWITRSNSVEEHPINIVVRKEELIKISESILQYCPHEKALTQNCKECSDKQCEAFFCLVVGSRTFNDYHLMRDKLDNLLSNQSQIVIVSGGANGADKLAERYARERKYPCIVFPAEWDKLGKSAGYSRNCQMHEFIAKFSKRGCVAFWDGKSKGTQHNFKLAEEYVTPIKKILFN